MFAHRDWLLPACLLLLVVDPLTAGCPAKKPAGIKVSLSGPADRAVVRREGRAVVLEIQSATGIGQADLRPASGGWPKSVRLRLRGLGQPGLEGFTLTKGRLTLHSSAGRVWPESREQSRTGKITERPTDRRYQLRITIKSDGDRQMAEITLPGELLTGDEPLHIEWIDAYRV
jgi:hypothetical protein